MWIPGVAAGHVFVFVSFRGIRKGTVMEKYLLMESDSTEGLEREVEAVLSEPVNPYVVVGPVQVATCVVGGVASVWFIQTLVDYNYLPGPKG